MKARRSGQLPVGGIEEHLLLPLAVFFDDAAAADRAQERYVSGKTGLSGRLPMQESFYLKVLYEAENVIFRRKLGGSRLCSWASADYLWSFQEVAGARSNVAAGFLPH